MPQNPDIVATKSPSCDAFVFDTSRFRSTPEGGDDGETDPDYVCKGHTSEGWALSWNPHRAGFLVSGSDDSNVCLWDINDAARELPALHVFKQHTSVVEDVAWHGTGLQPDVFASCSDDKSFVVWDARTRAPASTVADAHTGEVNTIAFSPFSEHTLLTGSSDATVALWDLRKLPARTHTFAGHSDEVFQVQWNKHNETIFGSAGADRRLYVWDLARIGAEQTALDQQDGPPEIL